MSVKQWLKITWPCYKSKLLLADKETGCLEQQILGLH